MADDFDVEAMLEAPYKQEADITRDDRDRDSDRRKKGRDSDRDRDKKSDRSRDHRPSKSRDKERRRSRDRERKRRSRSHSKDRRHRSRSRSRDRRSKESKSSQRLPTPDMTPEERDARTVFCMQLAARIRPRDLEDFFSSVGKVKDVRIIMDNKTRRSKGISYIEFKDTESVPLALGLTGQRLLGVPILVQASQAEKNRSAMGAATPGIVPVVNQLGPMRLYVGSLHFNITEDMLRGIFEPFGKITEIKLIRDHETNRSHGYGFVTFQNHDEAKKALEQLNGFELAGRPMKVGHVTERTAGEPGSSFFDNDEMDRAGVDLGATGRLQLMAKLAEGTGFQIPQAAANALNTINPGIPAPPVPNLLSAPPVPALATGINPSVTSTPPIATQCFMLSNMFDPATESNMNWEVEVRDDVIEECNKHGGVLHIYVDKASSQGNVFVKCPTISAAVASVAALHGRYFAGRVITAAYVPLPNYHQLFDEAQRTTQLLMPSKVINAYALNSGIPTISQFS